MGADEFSGYTELVQKWLPGVPVGILLVVLYFLFFPEKADKNLAMLFSLLRLIGLQFQKGFFKHDIQSRVNSFVKTLSRQTSDLETTKLRIEWVEKDIDQQAFIDAGKLILRLKKDDPGDMNFANGAYLYVSTSLLYRTKKYLSKSQKQAVDLFVTSKLIANEKTSVIGFFLDNFLHPITSDGNSKTAAIMDKFGRIDRAGLYFPILIQELTFLGYKFFGALKNQFIISEVNSLIDHLDKVSTREIGDEAVPLNFIQNYCKCGIAIIGRYQVINKGINPYIEYLRSLMTHEKLETVYILANYRNRKKIDSIVANTKSFFEKVDARKVNQTLTHPEFGQFDSEGYIITLRAKSVPIFQPSQK
ncbi:MAG: hypothetical protein OEZ02_00885 [Anaerolineae bacterium]|nr:hypothetical protein [Anaerolineae bacterium]